MQKISQKQINEFIYAIPKLEPQEFIGLARLLGVELMNEDEPREFEDILEDVLENFTKANRKRRKEFITLLRSVTKGKMLGAAEPSGSPIMKEEV